MALKPGRNSVYSDISYFMNEVAERGGVVVLSTIASGEAMDDAAALVTYSTSQSGKMPVGVLMCDMVNKDLTKTPLNKYKHEVQKGSKVTLWTIGEVNTNMIYPGQTINVGDPAYLGPSGLLTPTDTNVESTPIVGVFKSKKDADGYAKVFVNLPMATPRL